MLLFHDNSVKLIPLLALFLVCDHLKHSLALQLVLRVIIADLAIKIIQNNVSLEIIITKAYALTNNSLVWEHGRRGR